MTAHATSLLGAVAFRALSRPRPNVGRRSPDPKPAAATRTGSSPDFSLTLVGVAIPADAGWFDGRLRHRQVRVMWVGVGGGLLVFHGLDSSISLAFLRRFPTAKSAAWLSPKRLDSWLARQGYPGIRPPITSVS